MGLNHWRRGSSIIDSLEPNGPMQVCNSECVQMVSLGSISTLSESMGVRGLMLTQLVVLEMKKVMLPVITSPDWGCSPHVYFSMYVSPSLVSSLSPRAAMSIKVSLSSGSSEACSALRVSSFMDCRMMSYTQTHAEFSGSIGLLIIQRKTSTNTCRAELGCSPFREIESLLFTKAKLPEEEAVITTLYTFLHYNKLLYHFKVDFHDKHTTL